MDEVSSYDGEQELRLKRSIRLAFSPVQPLVGRTSRRTRDRLDSIENWVAAHAMRMSASNSNRTVEIRISQVMGRSDAGRFDVHF
jgi:hypothetical protein